MLGDVVRELAFPQPRGGVSCYPGSGAVRRQTDLQPVTVSQRVEREILQERSTLAEPER